jgi:hypothetical protein
MRNAQENRLGKKRAAAFSFVALLNEESVDQADVP